MGCDRYLATLMFRSWTSRPYFSKSSRTRAPNASAVPPIGSCADCTRFARIAGSASALPISALRRATDGRRCSRRDEHAEPLVEDEPLDAGFLEGRHIRQALRARRRGLGEQPQGAGLVVRHERRRSERPQLHVAGDEVVDGRAAAAIGHLLELDARELGEPLHDHVLRRALAAARRIAQARLLSSPAPPARPSVLTPSEGCTASTTGWRDSWMTGVEVLQRIVADLVDVRVARNRVGGDEDSVAVRSRSWPPRPCR